MIFNLKIIDWTVYGKPENNKTNKILLPNHILKKLTNDSYTRYPLIFRLYKRNKFIHISNVEFGNTQSILPAPPGNTHDIVVPYHIFIRLNVSYNENIYVRNVVLPSGKYVKLQGSNDKYVKDNIKQILENKLKNYIVLNVGDVIVIDETEFYIKELKDITGKLCDAVNINNTDLNVDFETPLESISTKSDKPIINYELDDIEKQMIYSDDEDNDFIPFSGKGHALKN